MDPAVVMFLGAAAVCFVVVVVAVRTGRILGVTFRSRFIARRAEEPGLYWSSLILFTAVGAFLIYAVISTRG